MIERRMIEIGKFPVAMCIYQKLDTERVEFFEAICGIYQSFDNSYFLLFLDNDEMTIILKDRTKKLYNVKKMPLIDLALELLMYAPLKKQNSNKWLYALDWLPISKLRKASVADADAGLIPFFYIIDILTEAKEDD